MAVYVDDRYLNSQDSDFVNLVISDLQTFLDAAEEKADQVLLFPPVSPYHRFLIHKTVEDFPVLCSFSVGEDDDRRSVVCLQELVLRNILSADIEATNQKSVKNAAAAGGDNESSVLESCSGDNTHHLPANTSSQKSDDSINSVDGTENRQEENLVCDVDTKDNTHADVETSTFAAEADVDISHEPHAGAADDADSATQHAMVSIVGQQTDEVLHDTDTPSVCDQSEHRTEAASEVESEPTSTLAVVTSDCLKDDHLHDEMSTETATDLQPDISRALMNELTTAVGTVRIVRPAVDYERYFSQETDSRTEEDYGRLIEIYDFPEGMITRDLLVLFRDFRDKHFDIKWVDKTHAIGIFSNQEIASGVGSQILVAFVKDSYYRRIPPGRQAVKLSSVDAEHVIANFDYPLVKLRPLHLASSQTKQAARKSKDLLEPYKPRPETTASTARNLVHGALGLRRPSSKEHTGEHKRHSKGSSDHKHSSSKSKRRVWDGKIRPCAMDME